MNDAFFCRMSSCDYCRIGSMSDIVVCRGGACGTGVKGAVYSELSGFERKPQTLKLDLSHLNCAICHKDKMISDLQGCIPPIQSFAYHFLTFLICPAFSTSKPRTQTPNTQSEKYTRQKSLIHTSQGFLNGCVCGPSGSQILSPYTLKVGVNGMHQCDSNTPPKKVLNPKAYTLNHK